MLHRITKQLDSTSVQGLFRARHNLFAHHLPLSAIARSQTLSSQPNLEACAAIVSAPPEFSLVSTPHCHAGCARRFCLVLSQHPSSPHHLQNSTARASLFLATLDMHTSIAHTTTNSSSRPLPQPDSSSQLLCLIPTSRSKSVHLLPSR